MPRRRDVLATLGAGTALLAGCESSPGTGTDPPDNTTTGGSARTTDRRTRAPTRTDTRTRTTTRADPRTPTTTTTGPLADRCHATWAGEADLAFAAANGFVRPVGIGDRLYVDSKVGLHALTPTLRERWRRPDVGPVATATSERLVTSGGDRAVGLDRSSGEVRWRFEPTGEYVRVAVGPSVHDGTLYVAASQLATPSTAPETEFSRLYALDVTTGTEQFVTDLSIPERRLVQPIRVRADDAGVFATLDSGRLVALDHDGTVRWVRGGSDWYAQPKRAGELLVQPLSGSVVAVDAATGETRWTDDTVESSVSVREGVVYGSGDGGPDTTGSLQALDAATGRQRWATPLPGCGRRPAVGSGALAIAVGCRDGPGSVHLVDRESGCLHGVYEQSADLTPTLAVAHGRLYATAGDDAGRLLGFELPREV